MENYTTRIGKILTTQKLSDRFIKTQVHYPKSPSEEEHGMLIFLVEILSPWFPSTEVGKTIIDTTIAEYYSGSKYADTLTRFEEALKKTNEKLADMASQGVNEWIGNINCTIIALKRNNIYVSHSGNTQIYLFRDKNLSEITEDISDKNSSPISTFITITNGTLNKGDKILIANQQLLNFVPLKSLREIINYTDVINSIHQIGKILRRKNIKNVNCILLELTTEKELAQISPQYLEEDTIYLDQEPETWLGTVLKNIKPKINQKLDRSGKIGARMWEKFLIQANDGIQKISPHAKKITRDLGYKIIKSWYKWKGKTIHETNQKKLLKRKNYFIEKKDSLRKEKNEKANFFKQLLINFFIWIKKLFLPQNRKKLYIILLILFLLIFGISLFLTLNNNQQNAENIQIENIINQVKADIKKAKGLIGSNQSSEARKILIDNFNNLNKYSKRPQHQKEIKSLLNQIRAYTDKIDKTTRYTTTKDLKIIGKNIKQDEILFLNNNFYYPKSGILYLISENQEKTKIANLPNQIKEIKTFINLGKNKIIFYTKDLKIYQYNLESEKFVRLDASGGWEKSNQIATFFNNIYLLENTGQIAKYTPIALGYSKARNLILANQLPENYTALDLAIDGNVYILFKNQDYTIYQFYNGRINKEFNLLDENSGIQLSHSKKIYTSEKLNSLYVLENNIQDFDGNKINRILEFSKDGSFIKQYKFSTNLGKIRDFAVNHKLDEIYILLDSDQLYSFKE